MSQFRMQDDDPVVVGSGSDYAYRHLPFSHIAPVGQDQWLRGMIKLLEISSKVIYPANISLVLMCDANRFVGGFEVCGWDDSSADQLASSARSILSAVVPWIGLGPTSCGPQFGPREEAQSFMLVPGDPPGTAAISASSLFWNVARGDPEHRWSMRVTVEGPSIYDGRTDFEGPALRSSAVISGTGPRGQLMAELFAGDVGGPLFMQTQLVCLEREPTTQLFPLAAIAYLWSIPGRIPEALPEERAVSRTELLAVFRESSCPNVLILGGSGRGKTTVIEHQIADCCERGEPAVVFDNHDGRLAERASAVCEAHGMSPLVCNFALDEPPCLQLTHAPLNTTPEEWAAEVSGIIRSVLWGQMPDDHFGSVATRCLRILIEMLARDPEGPRPLADAARILGAPEEEWVIDLLERIGDESLLNAFLAEVIPMLTAQDAGNTRIYLASKFDPLIGDAHVRTITSGSHDTVGIEDALVAGRPFILHAPSARLGDTGARLVAGVVLQRFWLHIRTVQLQSTVPLFVDEWQRLNVPAFGELLAEARKFHSRVILANQSLAQLDPKLRDIALGNIGCLATFRTGPSESAHLDAMFPTISASRLQRLGSHQMAVTTGDRDLIAEAPTPLDLEAL